MKGFQVTLDGLEGLIDIQNLPERVQVLASRAINKTLARARTRAAAEILATYSLPSSYLRGENSRLYIGRYAKETKLEGALAARRRPTSLARFVKGDTTPFKKGGLTVAIKPGSARYLKKAFIIKLRKGAELSEEAFNKGLAIRLPAGTSPSNALKPTRLGKGLWLLYGMSVQQAFIGENPSTGVAQKIKPEMAKFLADEFRRLQALEGL